MIFFYNWDVINEDMVTYCLFGIIVPAIEKVPDLDLTLNCQVPVFWESEQH